MHGVPGRGSPSPWWVIPMPWLWAHVSSAPLPVLLQVALATAVAGIAAGAVVSPALVGREGCVGTVLETAPGAVL